MTGFGSMRRNLVVCDPRSSINELIAAGSIGLLK